MLDICTNSVYSTQPPEMGARLRCFGQAGRRSMSHGWLCSSQKWGTSSQILARRHHSSLVFVTSVTNTTSHRVKLLNHISHTNTQVRHMEGTPRHTLGLQTQHTYSLEDNTQISQQNTNTTPKQHNHFQREDSHLTHTDSKRNQQTIHQHSQTQN